ncbi:MAG TPA: DUF6005 family protein [Polyangiaceae bacterium]|nr:DUF6005 family protein [Polyangiaceae bacterium]
MKTRQQVATCIYYALRSKAATPYLSAFQSDARLREDLALDSSAVLQLLVTLELEFGLPLPEETLMNGGFDTVRALAKLLHDAQPDRPADHPLDYEEDLKLHCFVSCQSEIIKRKGGLDQRALYFGVWDSEILLDERYALSYHGSGISHRRYADWCARLYGLEAHPWYDPTADEETNVRRLVELVETRAPHQHVMVMLDMFRLPERANEFNKDPFPHYLMLTATPDPEEWLVHDPDYRWEGIAQKERILHAMRHPAVGGGFVFDDSRLHAPLPRQIKAYYDSGLVLDQNPMTATIRASVVAHLAGTDRNGQDLPLAHLTSALAEVPILAIRKYAYEHGLAFFWRELNLDEKEFDEWCEAIAELVKTYKVIQFQSMKLATNGDRTVAERVFALLDEQDHREHRIKARLHEVQGHWCDVTFATPHCAAVGEASP